MKLEKVIIKGKGGSKGMVIISRMPLVWIYKITKKKFKLTDFRLQEKFVINSLIILIHLWPFGLHCFDWKAFSKNKKKRKNRETRPRAQDHV